jgi:PleD family two-component response regulator
MTNPRPAELKLLQLRERFTAALPRRIDEIAEALARCEADPSTLPDLERRFHSLAGTAGTYGLAEISALSAEGEDACGTDTSVSAALFDRLHILINAMRQTLSPAGAPRIFCVDDDPMHTWYLAMILKSEGYEIYTAVDGAEFRSQLPNVRPDLIVLDYVLPDATGVDLARFVRSDPSYATVPIVFLTGRQGVEHRIEATNVGGDDFLTNRSTPSCCCRWSRRGWSARSRCAR